MLDALPKEGFEKSTLVVKSDNVDTSGKTFEKIFRLSRPSTNCTNLSFEEDLQESKHNHNCCLNYYVHKSSRKYD